ncbi:MAG: NUDIX domain-containing protein [Sciscionella sp.]
MTDTDFDSFAQPRVASGVLYTDDAGRIMLVNPTYKDLWDLPGGYLQPGETPTEALMREIVEELGAALPVGPLLVADWAPSEREGDKLLFVFDGGVLSDKQNTAIRVDGVEISEFAYHGRDDLDDLLIPRLARRVYAALEARVKAETVYLEHGVRVQSTA